MKPLKTRTLFLTALALAILAASVSVTAGQDADDDDAEGSGLGDDEDDADAGLDEIEAARPSRPTDSVVNPSPTPDIRPTAARRPNAGRATVTPAGNRDSIYVSKIEPVAKEPSKYCFFQLEEEGSGFHSPDGKRVANTPTGPLSSATPPMPPRGGPNNGGGGAIVTSRIENQPPQLQKKLRKIPVTAGRYVSWKIPEDTFFDEEDGNTRNLRLTLRYKNGTVVSDSADWIRFDVKKQVVHLL